MKIRRLSFHHLLPGLSLAFTLFVFAPADLYLSIAEEFWFPLGMLFRWLPVCAAAAFAGITLLAWLLPARASVAFRSAVYACSFLVWLQGNALLIDYGELDGREIDWSAYTVPYVLDALLWIAVIALFVFLMFRFRQKFRRILEAAACVLLVTQVLTLGVLMLRDSGWKKDTEIRYLSREGLMTVSPEHNTLVFVLDSFDSELFKNLNGEYPELIAELCEDFTFYPDTAGGATRTKYAVPFIMTGTTNTKAQSYEAYLAESFEASPLIRELASGKYDSRIYSVSRYFDLKRDDAIGNIITGEPLSLTRSGMTLEFMKLVAFRCVPSALSRYFWTYTEIFEEYLSTIGNGAYLTGNLRFYRDLEEQGVTASAEKEAFRFIHVSGVHGPYTMDENCRQNGGSDETRQAIGALRMVAEYLQQLKALGLYEDATVIVMADHGYGGYHPKEQTPLFMVKLSGSLHPFETSDLPLSYVSLPEILVSALRKELTSMEPYRAASERYFYLHRQLNKTSEIIEYVIDGPVWEESIEPTGLRYYEDTQPPEP